MTSIASAFATPPACGWGYRGDPYLWDALGWVLSDAVASLKDEDRRSQNIEQSVRDAFRSLIRGGKKHSEGVGLSWLPTAGMSGGLVDTRHWQGTLLPEIEHRLSRLQDSEDTAIEYHPAEHRFRFAAWAAATAARSSRGVCTFQVAKGAALLRGSKLRWLALGSHWLPRSRDEFDHAHHEWCKQILRLGKKDISQAFTYGIAAKLVNVYLKALFLQTMVGAPFEPYEGDRHSDWNSSTRHLHPPIDRVLLREAAKRSDPATKQAWKNLVSIGWSKFSRRDYERALKLIRTMVGEDVAQIEVCWTGYQ